MLIPNHPNDERLSALASRETDATADATLTAHVSTCRRCTDLVTELGALRAALADLPDLAPSRPLRLLPPVEAAPAGAAADRLGGWARRFFAPVLASGAALALVGTIGTAAPALGPMAQSGAAPTEELNAGGAPAGEAAASAAAGGAPEAAASNALDEVAASTAPLFGAGADASEGDRSTDSLAIPATPEITDPGVQAAEEEPEPSDDESNLGFNDADQAQRETLTAERSPWPMVLFTGVALMIGALLLRWILVPRAG